MAESRAYKRLKAYYPEAHWQRFESWTGVGVFDTNACLNGKEIWVELKEVVPPKKLTDQWCVKPKVRPSQIAWQALREKAGGKTYIAIMIGPAMYILQGKLISELRQGMTLKKVKENNISIGLIL